ncbi:MAG: 4-hydroxyphenylpyruvate dioxygenase [Bdellovibrionales bacterium]|nr:4-hydroxyphenylpyruvate dioxygenase [Bdellovibrionales bacterium]
MYTKENPAGLKGIDFIEYSSPEPEQLKKLWESMGFVHKGQHKNKKVDLFLQGHTYFVLNREKDTFAENFYHQHGPSVCALAFRVHSAKKAFEYARAKGARAVPIDKKSHSFPAIYGVGQSIIYFVEEDLSHFEKEFHFFEKAISSKAGLLSVDHLTHNVPTGDMQKWCDFYQEVFNFTERRYFDIQGTKTGLVSKVMRSPCNTITIPINEPAKGERGKKSQIQEFLEEYKGSGIQHIALTTKNIVNSVKQIRSSGIDFLEVPDTYYEDLPKRVPQILKEDLVDLQKNKILADGDETGYLLQIFTKNVIGPVFYEIINRHNHDGFGEGNFQALFDAIERDQMQRGFL